MSHAIASLVLVLAAAPGDGPTDADIRRAIAAGVEFVEGRREGAGGWSYTFNHNHNLGITALAGLALLENGVGRDAPAIRGADRLVRELAPQSDQTYDVALSILFLARAQATTRGPDDDLIRQLAARLAAGEQGGMWSYKIPVEPIEPPGPYAKGPRRTRGNNGGGAGRGPTRRFDRGGDGDNSNTQFALLGLWAAGRHGFAADEPLVAIDGHFRGTQEADGGWAYAPHAPSYPAMTCAGLMGLAMAKARPGLAERQTARARGAELAADPAFAQALSSVKRGARTLNGGADIYALWSLERACVALGLRDLDGFDWYAAGARILLARQRPDGAWAGQWGDLPDTCLALLFLHKANLAFELDRVLKLPNPDARPAPATTSTADEPDPAPDPGGGGVSVVVRQVDESHFPEIAVDFEVKDAQGAPKADARKADFRVTEDDQPVTIESFRGPSATESRPTTVVLVLDHSRSMEEEDRIGALKRAVGVFADHVPAGSRVAVIAFGSDVQLICPFTEDPRKVRAAVDALVPEGATRYYDAVAEALTLLAKEPGRRAVLAMTDGEDTFSTDATLDADIRAARVAGLPVHTLGLGSEGEIEADALRKLAAETRGQYFPADKPDRLAAIYEQIAVRLGNSYSLTYRAARKLPDGTLRPIRIFYRAQVRAAGEAAVFIRGMVVPAAGWPRLFLLLLAVLIGLAILPGRLARKPARPT